MDLNSIYQSIYSGSQNLLEKFNSQSTKDKFLIGGVTLAVAALCISFFKKRPSSVTVPSSDSILSSDVQDKLSELASWLEGGAKSIRSQIEKEDKPAYSLLSEEAEGKIPQAHEYQSIRVVVSNMALFNEFNKLKKRMTSKEVWSEEGFIDQVSDVMQRAFLDMKLLLSELDRVVKKNLNEDAHQDQEKVDWRKASILKHRVESKYETHIGIAFCLNSIHEIYRTARNAITFRGDTGNSTKYEDCNADENYAKLFFQKSTRQYKWRKLKNKSIDLLGDDFKEKIIKKEPRYQSFLNKDLREDNIPLAFDTSYLESGAAIMRANLDKVIRRHTFDSEESNYEGELVSDPTWEETEIAMRQ